MAFPLASRGRTETGHERAHHPVDVLAPGEQQLAEPVGDGRQDDVVERPAQALADHLDVVHRWSWPRRSAGAGPMGPLRLDTGVGRTRPAMATTPCPTWTRLGTA